LKIISETNFETGGKIKNKTDRILTEAGPHWGIPERAGPIPFRRAGDVFRFKPDMRGLLVRPLKIPNRYAAVGLESNGASPSSTSGSTRNSPAAAGVWLDSAARRRGRRTRRRGCRSTAAAQLLHLAPAAAPTAAGNSRNAAARVSRALGVSEGKKRRER
jgi:hypothetical protein